MKQLFEQGSATILSVFPVECVSTTRKHAGLIDYVLPAAERDKIIVREYTQERLRGETGAREHVQTTTDCEVGSGYSLCRVWDTVQFTRDYTSDNQDAKIPHLLSATENATGLVNEWSNCVANGIGRVGISLIAGDTPTPDEYATLMAQQADLADAMIREGNRLYDAREPIGDLYRKLAVWSGAQNLPWITRYSQKATKDCPACAEVINKEALRCRYCSVDLIDYWRKLVGIGMTLDRDTDPRVYDMIQNLGGGKTVARVAAKNADTVA